MLLHRIVSTIAEFYSRNLATEVTKGMAQKAAGGGTIGKAPIGYLNVRIRDELGREVLPGIAAAGRTAWLSLAQAPARLLGSDGARLPLVVIEAVRTTPVEQAVFSHAKVVGVTQGRAVVQTPAGRDEISAGDLMVIGSGIWISVHPLSVLRTWTIYSAAPISTAALWSALLGIGLGAGQGTPGILYVHRAGSHHQSGQLSGMAQSVGYLVAATSPVLASVLHGITGSWTPSLIAMLALLLANAALSPRAGRGTMPA